MRSAWGLGQMHTLIRSPSVLRLLTTRHPSAMPDDLQREAVEVLQRLVRIDTTNPPGNERPAQEYLAGLLEPAGFEVELVGPDPERPNLVARLRGHSDGPVLGFLSHVDTVV